MIIKEVVETQPDSSKLVALSKFLSGRANDETASKQISQDAFIQAAKSLGVNITPDSLANIVGQEPLSNILEPLNPSSGVISFKGDTEAATGMSINQAHAVVDSNAKAAMKRRQ